MKNELLAYRLQEAFKKHGDHAAIRIGKRSWSYGDLYQKSLAVSSAIRKASSSSSPVAILGGKSFMTYAGICGALFSSRAYMPLNIKFPVNRNQKMLELSGADIIIADEECSSMLRELKTECKVISGPDLSEGDIYEITAGPGEPAYLLFTSGTTGVPKGVPVSNRNVCAYIDHMQSAWDFKPNDNFSQTFDLTFDLSVHDMMLCWLSGACLCIPEDDSPFRMASYIRDQKISVWFSVPSVAVLMDRMRLLKPDSIGGIRISFFCGEPLPDVIAGKWQAATGGKTVVNLYGPTEATIAISAYGWDEDHHKSKNGITCLGHIFDGQEFMLLDPETMKPAQKEGELCLGGSQVISGYLDDDQLTEKYFIQMDEQPGKRWYRTGDLACLDEEGSLFFLGRTDAEVKISGYRVNLLELDAVIRKAAGSELVASILHEKQTPAIVSFVGRDKDVSEQAIMQACKLELPWYMIPERIIFVNEMPLNINGKIDRNKLKQMINE